MAQWLPDLILDKDLGYESDWHNRQKGWARLDPDSVVGTCVARRL